MKTPTPWFFGCAGAVLAGAAAWAQAPALDRASLSGGGGTSTAGAVALTATIGQPYAGVVNGKNSTVSSGFWGSLATEPGPLPQELIVNGSFENVARAFAPGSAFPGPNGVMLLPVGSTAIPGWTVVSAALVWGIIDDNGTVLPSGAGTPFGHFYVDLTGWLDALPYAGVTQTIPTSPGQTYDLSFALGTVENDYRWRGPTSVSVAAGSSSNLFSYTPTGTDWQWRTFSWAFTATSPSTPITLTGTSAAASLLAMDNVSVRAAAVAKPLRIATFGLAGNNLHFSFSTSVGRSYVIESRAELTGGEWAAVPGSTSTASGTTVQATVPIALAQPQRFYRVRGLP